MERMRANTLLKLEAGEFGKRNVHLAVIANSLRKTVLGFEQWYDSEHLILEIYDTWGCY